MKKKHIDIFQWVLFSILIIYVLSLVYTIFWGALNSLKTERDFLLEKNRFGLPKEWMFSNYKTVLQKLVVPVERSGNRIKVTILGQVINSLSYAVGCCIFSALAPCLMGYAVAHFSFKWNTVIVNTVIVTMALPVIGAGTSLLDLIHTLGLHDNFLGMYINSFSFANMYFLVYLAAFKSIPASFSEAAYIDGASELQVMVKIQLPLVSKMFVTIALLGFIGAWNDYSTPLLYLPSHPTFAYGVWYTVLVATTPDMNMTTLKLASAMILVLPVLILFIAFKKRIMTNLSAGGEKE